VIVRGCRPRDLSYGCSGSTRRFEDASSAGTLQRRTSPVSVALIQNVLMPPGRRRVDTSTPYYIEHSPGRDGRSSHAVTGKHQVSSVKSWGRTRKFLTSKPDRRGTIGCQRPPDANRSPGTRWRNGQTTQEAAGRIRKLGRDLLLSSRSSPSRSYCGVTIVWPLPV